MASLALFFPGGIGSLLDDGEQTTTDKGYFPKTRKPLTITKQRERWTEEDHKRFFEKMSKLYGNAWRKIEEHVGTGIVVQIRCHAHKFFSKVLGGLLKLKKLKALQSICAPFT